MKKKIVTVFMLIVMLSAVFLFAGCEPRETGKTVGIGNKRETPMTIEEIREMIRKKYFDADGNAKCIYYVE